MTRPDPIDNSPRERARSIMYDNDTILGSMKIAIAWMAVFVADTAQQAADLPLSWWVQLAALIFTVSQTIFLLRDKWWRERKK